jgi:hypothetical protein
MALPTFSFTSLLIKSPILGIITLTSTAAAVNSKTINITHAFSILVVLFILDLITGIAAGYFEWKKTSKTDKWFFGKGEGFSSDKFKKMFVKILVYLGSPLVLQQFQKIFLIKNFKYEEISGAEITMATGLILLFCLNEGYSIFHENLPKCGFNLYDRIRKLMDLKKKITDGLQ